MPPSLRNWSWSKCRHLHPLLTSWRAKCKARFEARVRGTPLRPLVKPFCQTVSRLLRQTVSSNRSIKSKMFWKRRVLNSRPPAPQSNAITIRPRRPPHSTILHPFTNYFCKFNFVQSTSTRLFFVSMVNTFMLTLQSSKSRIVYLLIFKVKLDNYGRLFFVWRELTTILLTWKRKLFFLSGTKLIEISSMDCNWYEICLSNHLDLS